VDLDKPSLRARATERKVHNELASREWGCKCPSAPPSKGWRSVGGVGPVSGRGRARKSEGGADIVRSAEGAERNNDARTDDGRMKGELSFQHLPRLTWSHPPAASPSPPTPPAPHRPLTVPRPAEIRGSADELIRPQIWRGGRLKARERSLLLFPHRATNARHYFTWE
jgi:hypothetical protein